MRLLLSFLVLFGMLAALSPEADARKASRSYSKGYAYKAVPHRHGANTAARYYQYRDTDSMECIRARDVDPSGNYAGYPCWAQYALSPKRRGF